MQYVIEETRKKTRAMPEAQSDEDTFILFVCEYVSLKEKVDND